MDSIIFFVNLFSNDERRKPKISFEEKAAVKI